MELSGEVRDRSVGAAELLQHAAPGRVRQRGERSVEAGFVKLNHMVQFIAGSTCGVQEETKALGGMTRKMLEVSAAGRAGTPDDVGTVGALLMGSDGAFITGSDFLMDGGVTAAYWFGELAPKTS